ncbi:capsule biosynthesis GfcC family protein [Marinomonas posidonica]|uniref:capsule biosynthesis GfcC family protein n=1 Tax=Marinomonas posidonica TaxID=936476 RepID=UPI003736524F
MCRPISYVSFISLCFLPLFAMAQPVKIHLLQPEITLEYEAAVRLSQVLSDAQKQVDYPVYSLGISVISPSKQALVDQQKNDIFNALRHIDSAESKRIVKQLAPLHFVYRERLETRLKNVRTVKKNNPLLSHDYALSVPIRPTFIRVISPKRTSMSMIKQTPNSHLKDYLTPDIAGDDYDSAWVIQADQKVQYIKGIQWQGKHHYLSPGSLVFVGLENLPHQYKTLNQDIAQLLTQHLEL